MHSRSRLLFVVLLLVAGVLALPWVASAQEPVTSRLKLSIGGYIKPEMMYRTNSGATAFSGAIPGTQNFGFSAIAQHGTIAGQNGEFAAFANETRFNFTLTAPDWRGLKPTGYLEFDFDGDTASTLERFCPAVIATGSGAAACAGTQDSGNSAGSINNGGFRIRHAFFRLSGEGAGGNYELTFGQTWGIFGMIPYYSGSSLSFGGATVFGQRQPQLSLRHTIRFARDFAWETAIGAMGDTTNYNEMPAGDLSGRLIYSGWQGWQGGGRAPTSIGVSARVQRQKADLYSTAAFTADSSRTNATRSLSATAWGVTGGIFLPILPGTSATDRTWGLSALGEFGYGEGVHTLIPFSPFVPAAVRLGSANRADFLAGYFKPSSCTGFGAGTSLANTAAAGVGPAICPAGQLPTEYSLFHTPWASYNVQFYLPWNFWLSGGQKWLWFTNADNAVAQTSVNTPGGAAVVFSPGAINQGQFNPSTGVVTCVPSGNSGNCTALFGGRDSIVKRMHYNYVSAFYDMTPNIRWGFEWGMHGSNRRNSDQDNQSHRWQFGAYYFF